MAFSTGWLVILDLARLRNIFPSDVLTREANTSSAHAVSTKDRIYYSAVTIQCSPSLFLLLV
jgi:hypothetical protein